MQSRRLDGVGSLPELTFADALAIAKRVDVEQALLVLDSAAPSASRVVDGDEDLVPGVGEILRHSLHFVPRAVPPLPHGVDFRSPTKRELLTYLVDDVRGKARCRLRIVAAPVTLEEPLDDFDVRLRHRHAVSRSALNQVGQLQIRASAFASLRQRRQDGSQHAELGTFVAA
jgi:hypothetical protein